jgi:hypothetical protein
MKENIEVKYVIPDQDNILTNILDVKSPKLVHRSSTISLES